MIEILVGNIITSFVCLQYQTEADAALAGIIMVVEMYPSLYVTYKNGDFMYTNPTLPLTCLVPKIVFNLFDYVFKILAGTYLNFMLYTLTMMFDFFKNDFENK